MRVKRPASATAAGVLCIVFGSLFTLCGVCGVASVAIQGAAGPGGNPFGGGDPMALRIQEELQRELDKVGSYNIIAISNTIFGLVHAILMLICGIGILNLRSWARTNAIVLSMVGIGMIIFQTAYQLLVVMPAMNNAFQAIFPRLGPVPPNAIQAVQSITRFTAIVILFFYGLEIVFLAIVLGLLLRGNVRMAFADAASADPDSYDEYPRERRRWRREEDEEEDYPRPREEPPQDDWRFRSEDR